MTLEEPSWVNENSFDQIVKKFLNKDSPEPQDIKKSVESISESLCDISGSGHSSLEEEKP